MTVPEPMALPEQTLRIAELVAVEFAGHELHVQRRFATLLAARCRALRLDSADPCDKAFNRAVELCARVAEQLADVPVPDCAGHARTAADA